MYSNTRSLPFVRTFAEAKAFFDRTKKPPRAKKWTDYQRPLKNSSAHHYRIERVLNSDIEAYDLVLYRTVMARFYAPDSHGHEVRLYNGDQSQTSKSFLSNVANVFDLITVATSDNEQVVVPFYAKNAYADGLDCFCVKLVINKDGKLVKNDSWHTPHFRYISSAEDKQKRIAVRERLKTYMLLAELRMPEFEAEAVLSNGYGMPFAQAVTGRFRWQASQALADMMYEDMPPQSSIDLFFQLGQEVFSMLASKRGYKQAGFRLNTYWGQNLPTSKIDELEKPVTPKEFIKAFTNMCLKLLNVSTGTERQGLPQFMRKEDFQYSNRHV